jgi:hypothetical protein
MVTGRLQLKQKYDGSQVAMLIYVQNSGMYSSSRATYNSLWTSVHDRFAYRKNRMNSAFVSESKPSAILCI